jgi:DNA-binding MarR family transcriptional regulator
MGKQQTLEDVVAITRAVRRLFHQLKAYGTTLHADTDVTVPMRGVLETIVQKGPSTVPRMARMRPVSRQHIQRIVDELLERGLVRLDANPDHKRSSLVSLTQKGRATFHSMLASEIAAFDHLARGLSRGEIATARKVLQQLTTRLDAMLAEQPGATGDDEDADA